MKAVLEHSEINERKNTHTKQKTPPTRTKYNHHGIDSQQQHSDSSC